MSNLEHYFENLLFLGEDVNGDWNKNALTKEEQNAVEMCAQYILYTVFCGRDELKDCLNSYTERQWIPTSERFPEENGVYLATMCDRNRIYLCRYDKGGRGNESYWKYSIKAWMPLPEPYKGEQTK